MLRRRNRISDRNVWKTIRAWGMPLPNIGLMDGRQAALKAPQRKRPCRSCAVLDPSSFAQLRTDLTETAPLALTRSSRAATRVASKKPARLSRRAHPSPPGHGLGVWLRQRGPLRLVAPRIAVALQRDPDHPFVCTIELWPAAAASIQVCPKDSLGAGLA